MNQPNQPANAQPPHAPDYTTDTETWVNQITKTARALPYPPTPDVVAAIARRRAGGKTTYWPPRVPLRQAPLYHAMWLASLLLALLMTLWAVPPVRATLLEFLQIGAVRIWLIEPTPTPIPTPIPTLPPQHTRQSATVINTPRPTPTPFQSLFNLAGETTLDEAAHQAGFAIRLPMYPADLGPPDGVFYQYLNGPVVVLVWMNPAHPTEAEYSLHIFGAGASVTKGVPSVVETATVNGREVAWLQGPYMLSYGSGSEREWQMRYLVSGRVLLWQEDGLTYRLESNLSFEEAIKMAQSLK